MLELTEQVFLILVIILFLLGILGNGFIGLVNGGGWFKNKTLSLSDFIITFLALSRIILLWILLIDGVLLVLPSKVQDDMILREMLGIFWTFTNHLSIWLATCLSVLYCLKIASFSHPTFLWLKWRVFRVVLGMLLAAVLLSCASALSRIHEFKICAAFSEISGTGNVSEHIRKKSKYDLVHALGILWDLPSLIVMLVSYFLLLVSLGRHIQRMQLHGTNSRDTTTQAHRKATKIILSFLFFFLLYYICILLSFFRFFLPGPTMVKMIGEVFSVFYSAGHSFIIILGSNKLKQTFVKMLWCETCQLQIGSKESLAP
ncbi:taste receptor type 2 member 3-like [Sorex araneus]|uniref:taste receptor type 2 member 3-like n=1 Tax=Sorex araneus TaxID=42254 RepID=UPI0024335B42|nr:taste receptor type 2 member 3-like [Sorex araneus]